MNYPFEDVLIEARQPKLSWVGKILLGSALLLLVFLGFCCLSDMALGQQPQPIGIMQNINPPGNGYKLNCASYLSNTEPGWEVCEFRPPCRTKAPCKEIRPEWGTEPLPNRAELMAAPKAELVERIINLRKALKDEVDRKSHVTLGNPEPPATIQDPQPIGIMQNINPKPLNKPRCSPLMHTVTEKEWQELTARLKALEGHHQ